MEHDKHVIRQCIEGLAVYAITIAENNPKSHKIEEISNLIGDMVSYWGLDYGENAKSSKEYQQDFMVKVDASISGDKPNDISVDSYLNLANGLYRHGRDLVVAHGSDFMSEILQVSDMLEDIASYTHYETATLLEMSSILKAEVKELLDNYNLPGQTIEGENVQNYIIKQAILFESDRGFAFAHNPEAVEPYVTWHMFNDNGKLSHESGNYFSTEGKALIDYINRVSKHKQDYIAKEKPLPESPKIESKKQETKKLIRFIDSQYRELFMIPDGENIRITYPASDGRGQVERSCKYLDETHVQIEGSTYHICQFAEAMDRLGAIYEPANQVTIKLMPPALGEGRFYTFNRDDSNACAGSLHGDFGNDGSSYRVNFVDRENGLFDSEIQSELQVIVYALRQDLLKDRDSMISYCKKHPEAKLSDSKSSGGLEDFETYGFKLKTQAQQYFINCFAHDKDSRFTVYVYSDKHALEQSHGRKDSVDKENSSYTSVLGAIEDNKRTSTLPRKESARTKHKNKQDEL